MSLFQVVSSAGRTSSEQPIQCLQKSLWEEWDSKTNTRVQASEQIVLGTTRTQTFMQDLNHLSYQQILSISAEENFQQITEEIPRIYAGIVLQD